MGVAELIRPVFREGERLTAGRLNGAFEFLRCQLRRVLAAPIGPGVAIGLQIRLNNRGILVVDPGVAIDGRGRLIVLSEAAAFDVGTVIAEAGDLGPSQAIGVFIELEDATSPIDPCASPTSSVRYEPRIHFRPTHGVSVNVQQPAANCAPPWADLDTAGDGSRCAIQLGLVVEGNGVLTDVTMGRWREGIGPRMDSIRNTFDELIVDFRTGDDERRARFIAPAGGRDVQATHMAEDMGRPAAARVSPYNTFPLEFAGGTPSRSLEEGFAGLAAVPIAFEGPTAGVEASTVLSLVESPADDQPIAVEVVPGGMVTGDRLLGLAAGRPYLQGEGAARRYVIPVAVAGVLEVDLVVADVSVGAPLTHATPGSNELREAVSGEVVIAKIARTEIGLDRTTPWRSHAFVVHPPYRLP
ncbi:MAG: hypothetical protein AAGF12_32100 [Myxococcota bacterium]